ncbi:MAG: hypothetical protein JW832_05265 [Deltaproteobacteria bacterium]|nr:hypothetical protein [Deltaproteobacteria bacterium]
MNCIVYEKKSGSIAGQIIGLLRGSAGDNKTELYHSIKALSERLRSSVDGLAVMVLIAADRNDLLNILAVRNLFGLIRVIIILPDREEESVSLGYKLQPRFLTYVNGDVAEVHAVLNKLLALPDSNAGI